jgi:heptaprenyl diphosphate synthase
MSRRMIPGLESPDPVLEREIRGRLDEVEAALEKAVRADSDMLAETAQYLLAAGGKRFRPMLVLLSGYFGDPSDPRLVPGSVSIELVHQATLYHDDVIDEADARHAVQSANARWSNTVAILTGDYLFAKASEISTDLGTDICALLARTIATLCDGQIREVEAAGRVEQSEADYLDIIRRKTGALIATSCRLGGMLSDAPAEALDVLEQYGEALGLAFQLSDDIMDLTASQETLGKEPGQDLREGVYTLPVLHALSGPRAAELRELLRDGPPSGERLDRALEVVRAPGHLARARSAVVAEVDRAHGLIERLSDGPARTALGQLAEFLAARCDARGSGGSRSERGRASGSLAGRES